MDRKEYTDRVLGVMKNPDSEEQKAIREELDAHMEDWVLDLMDHGYTEEIAEQRAVEHMGDPEEVGRELDKQYPKHWKTIEVVAGFVTVFCIFQILLSIGILGMAWDGIAARFTNEIKTSLTTVYAEEQLDHRIPIGNDVLRVMAVRTGKEAGVLYAEVTMYSYDRFPGGWVDQGLLDNVKLWNEERIDDPLLLMDTTGADSIMVRRGGGGHIFREYTRQYIPIAENDTRVYLTYDRFGESFELEIPLPEVSE